MRFQPYVAATLLATLLPVVAVAAERPQLGLTVENGLLLRDGKPYRGIGANYFDLFYRMLKDPSDESSRNGLRQLSRADIPFVRFMCGGFWPVDYELYRRGGPALVQERSPLSKLDRLDQIAQETGGRH